MSRFSKYRRSYEVELSPISKEEMEWYQEYGHLLIKTGDEVYSAVSMTKDEEFERAPELGDYVARNPNNHNDYWFVKKQYVEDKLEKL